jgi:hypothetical protein
VAEREMGRGHNIIDMGTGNNGGGRPDAVKVIQYSTVVYECPYLWVRNVRTFGYGMSVRYPETAIGELTR